MRRIIVGALALAALGLAAGPGQAATPIAPAPHSMIEPAACSVVRQRTVRPNGAVVFRNVRRCGPAVGRRGCRTIRSSIRRPNGAVVYKTRRVCG